MKKYKCPNCGKISTSMYCDTCEKSIPSSCAIDNVDAMSAEAAATTGELLEIKEYTKMNNSALDKIERHTKVMAVIMVISAVCTVANAVFMFIGFMS